MVATPANASTTCDGGLITASPGSSTIFFSNGFMDGNESCSVSVDVLSEFPGPKGNISGVLSFFDGGVLTAGRASATLDVFQPTLRKLFTDDPVPPGGTVTLEFTITNFDRGDSATDISFFDDLDAALSGLTALGLPLNDICGAGSQLSGVSLLSFSGGSLAPEASCTFSVTLQVPGSADPGVYVNTTSSISYDLGGDPVVDSPGEDDLTVVPAPVVTKSFVDDPVTGGGDLVTLSFTVTNSSPTDQATDISFVDILDTQLPTATATPGADPCGAGSTVTFFPLFNPPPPSDVQPARIELSGGTLAALGDCTFEVTLDVLPNIPTGIYPNVTSPISATVGGVTVSW